MTSSTSLSSPTVTLTALLDKEFEDLPHIVQDLVPVGLTVLAAAPKFGKSFMVLGLALAVAEGHHALGDREVSQGDALYLALEDNEQRLQQRSVMLLNELGVPASPNLEFRTEAPRMNDGLIEALAEWVQSVPNPKLIIVDVLSRIRPEGIGIGYDVDYKWLSGLKQFAYDTKVGVLLVHHTRKGKTKSGDDPFDALRGSGGITGVPDALMLALKPNRTSKIGELHVTGRDFEDQALSIERQAFGSWLITGDLDEANNEPPNPDRVTVIEVLTEHGTMKPKQLAEVANLNYENTKKLVRRMRHDGEIVNDGTGAYSIPPPLPAKV